MAETSPSGKVLISDGPGGNTMLFRHFIDGVKDYAIFLLDIEGRVASWNGGAQRIKGYEPEEIVGRYFAVFYPPDERTSGKPERELEIARTTGRYEEEGWRVRKDGTRFWANVVLTAIFSDTGDFLGFTKVTRDLSERKQKEEALRASEEHYRLLTYQLDRKNRELEQFTSIVAHDLQEPLRTVHSYLQLIDRRLELGELEGLPKLLSRAELGAQRMRALISSLLEYSRIENAELSISSLNVHALVSEAISNLEASIGESDASVCIESEVEEINGDRIQLLQLLQNLIGNALKFKSDRPLQVEILVHDTGREITLGVRDNGLGIPQDYITKIFEIFRRVHSHSNVAGMGIGLAICRRIAERHGGRIWAESREGEGTTFYFTLPKERVPQWNSES